MSDFLTELIAADPVEAREVTHGGKSGTVHFKRITAGERAQLLKGQTVQARQGDKATVEIDLAENEGTKHSLVLFSVCKADGSRVFKNLEAVRAVGSRQIDVLYEHASKVNADTETDAGKA